MLARLAVIFHLDVPADILLVQIRVSGNNLAFFF